MKPIKPSQRQMLSLCSEIRPDDGVDPRTFFRKSSGRKTTNRKALQLCGAIARTLSQVLAWESSDDLLRTAVVQSVEPAPDSTRVLVTVAMPATEDGVNAKQLSERLNRSRGRLRAEVGAAIHRKRVPEVVFQVVAKGEVDQ
ncbi:MAG TPA: ribosome-binding factor A [Gemmataceae bacterium]|jgi:ribosome-binding factor A|nr:ribosome-binding factor A [Gemmataceae bacterium]